MALYTMRRKYNKHATERKSGKTPERHSYGHSRYLESVQSSRPEPTQVSGEDSGVLPEQGQRGMQL